MLGQSKRAPVACLMLVCALMASTSAIAHARAMSVAEREVIGTINGLRADFGAKPLRPDRRLASAAKEHSDDMLARDFFAHSSSDGATPVQRVRRYRRDAYVGEVLAWRPASADTSALGVTLMWLQSRPHLKVLTDRGFGRIGVSRQEGELFGMQVVVWTADLSARW